MSPKPSKPVQYYDSKGNILPQGVAPDSLRAEALLVEHGTSKWFAKGTGTIQEQLDASKEEKRRKDDPKYQQGLVEKAEAKKEEEWQKRVAEMHQARKSTILTQNQMTRDPDMNTVKMPMTMPMPMPIRGKGGADAATSRSQRPKPDRKLSSTDHRGEDVKNSEEEKKREEERKKKNKEDTPGVGPDASARPVPVPVHRESRHSDSRSRSRPRGADGGKKASTRKPKGGEGSDRKARGKVVGKK
jgi:hypothetical protein